MAVQKLALAEVLSILNPIYSHQSFVYFVVVNLHRVPPAVLLVLKPQSYVVGQGWLYKVGGLVDNLVSDVAVDWVCYV